MNPFNSTPILVFHYSLPIGCVYLKIDTFEPFFYYRIQWKMVFTFCYILHYVQNLQTVGCVLYVIQCILLFMYFVPNNLFFISLTIKNQFLTCAISFRVAQKLINETFTKSAPKQTVTVFSSSVSCEPNVTI